MKLTEEVKEAIRLLGRQGGLKTKRIYGRKHYARIGKIAMEKRWHGKAE